MEHISFYFAKFIAKIQIPALRKCNINKKAKISEKCQLQNVTIGKYSYIGKAAIISDTVIGNFCSIGGYGQIGGGMHPLEMVSTSPSFLSGHSASGKNFCHIPFKTSETVYIDNDVWIGAGVYIKGGVHIGNGAVIGAHSVVTHNVPPYTIVAGVPAVAIRKRFDECTISKLEKTEWWNWTDDMIQKYAQFFENPQKLFDALSPVIEANNDAD